MNQDFQTQPPVKSAGSEAKTWAMILHLSQLANFVIPFAGLVAPILIWQLKKEEMPSLDAHGKIVANWMLSAIIYGVISGILVLLFIGFLMLAVLGIVGIVFPIIGAVKAANGEVWPYPLSIKFFN